MDKALPLRRDVWREGLCPNCGSVSGTFYLVGEDMVCRHCLNGPPSEVPYFKQTEYLTPAVPNAPRGHLSDIEDRRWHPQEKRMFYYSKEKPKTYFLPKG